jgi:hypothetical protein
MDMRRRETTLQEYCLIPDSWQATSTYAHQTHSLSGVSISSLVIENGVHLRSNDIAAP